MTRGDPDNLGRPDRRNVDVEAFGGAVGGDVADAALDALLAAARWPEPPAATESRLRARWAGCSPARPAPRRRLGRAWAAAAAAAVVVAGTAAPLIVRRPWTAPTAAAGHGTATTTEVASPAASPSPAPSPDRASSVPGDPGTEAAFPAVTVSSRPASLGERWVMLSARPPAVGGSGPATGTRAGADRPGVVGSTARLPPVRPPSDRPAPAVTKTPAGVARRSGDADGQAVDPAVRGLFGWVTGSAEVRRRLAALAAAGGADARQVVIGRWLSAAAPPDVDAFLAAVLARDWREDALAAWRADARPPVGLLFARFDDAFVDRRLAAAHVLGAAGDDAVRAALERMVRDNASRREALAALLSRGRDADGGRTGRFLDATARADRAVHAQIGLARLDLRRLF